MSKSVDEIKGEIKEDIDKLMENYMEYKEEGFRTGDTAKFAFIVGSRLVEAIENVEGVSGEQKKEVVMSAARDIYRKVNPDIPWIPEPFETMIEAIMLERACGRRKT